MSIPCDDLDDIDDYGDDMNDDMGFADGCDSDNVWQDDDSMDDAESFDRDDMEYDPYYQPLSPDKIIGRELYTDLNANIGALGAFAASVLGANALFGHSGDTGAVPHNHLNTPPQHAHRPPEHVIIPPRRVNRQGVTDVHTPRTKDVNNVRETSIRNHDPEPEKRHYTIFECFLIAIVAILLVYLLINLITA